MTPTIVFDIDNTICIAINSSNLEYYQEMFPDCLVVKYTIEIGIENTYVFIPHLIETFLAILSWRWEIAFFSGGSKSRNIFLVNFLFNYIYEKYGIMYEAKVYSFEHLTKNYRSIDDEINSFSIHYQYKKDLRIINPDISNIILIDDYTEYILHSQFPFIKILNDCLILKQEVAENERLKDNYFNSKYIIAILSLCKDRMANLDETLRQSLTEILTIPEELKDHVEVDRMGFKATILPLIVTDPANILFDLISNIISIGDEILTDLIN